jgi:hypothetical protein
VIEIPDRVVVSLVILIPGAAATAALFPPGRMSFPGRVALTFGLGMSAVGSVAWALATARSLTATSFVVGLSLFTVSMVVVALRRGSLGERARALWADVKADPWPIAIGVAMLVALAFVRLSFSPLPSVGSRTALKYWADGVEIANSGRVPELTIQYGQNYAPATSKMFLNCFSAAMHLVTGPHVLQSLAAVKWVTAIFVPAVMWWLGREFGLRLTALLLALATMSTETFLSAVVATYTAETYGRILAFCALALMIRGLRRERDWTTFMLAGVLFGASATTHLVPTMIALGVVFWCSVYELLRRRLWPRGALLVAAGMGIAVVAFASISFLPG